MTIDQWLLATQDLIALFGFAVIIIQLRDSNRQTKVESHIQLYAINRELIAMGFSNPQLFQILKDTKDVDPTIERRYLQLWLNQLCLVHSFAQNGIFTKEVQTSFEHDLRDMMAMSNMRRHWTEFGKYYPASFRKAVDGLLHDAGHNRTNRIADLLTN